MSRWQHHRAHRTHRLTARSSDAAGVLQCRPESRRSAQRRRVGGFSVTPTPTLDSLLSPRRPSGGVLVWRRVESERCLQPLPCQRVIPPQGQASKDGSTIEHIVGTGSQLGPATLQASSSVDRSDGPQPSAAESVDSP
ncbi:uncharacterized protein LOC122363685 [Amphibalanus amphitrite]|uniref:uncharacterized protein LOC122363685 n=1 Tax=Amphibalanus amphitrite TaxID=1232801 RepID=UPI001C8FF118|nr:uncharacterized protein LOC122363685 [Amphibalanus amphitrite]